VDTQKNFQNDDKKALQTKQEKLRTAQKKFAKLAELYRKNPGLENSLNNARKSFQDAVEDLNDILKKESGAQKRVLDFLQKNLQQQANFHQEKEKLDVDIQLLDQVISNAIDKIV